MKVLSIEAGTDLSKFLGFHVYDWTNVISGYKSAVAGPPVVPQPVFRQANLSLK